jgi:hypothetical protein
MGHHRTLRHVLPPLLPRVVVPLHVVALPLLRQLPRQLLHQLLHQLLQLLMAAPHLAVLRHRRYVTQTPTLNIVVVTNGLVLGIVLSLGDRSQTLTFDPLVGDDRGV